MNRKGDIVEVKDQSSKAQEIWNLLLVIGGGGALALLVAVFFIVYYGPSGLYQAKFTVISPDVLNEMHYEDINPGTGAKTQFVFDKIEFLYFDRASNKWNKALVSKDKYRQFYQVISNDTSLSEVSSIVTDQFNVGRPASLSTIVKAEGRTEATKQFQEVVFASEGDIYRVSLHENTGGNSWAYFRHSGIYQKAIEIFSLD